MCVRQRPRSPHGISGSFESVAGEVLKWVVKLPLVQRDSVFLDIQLHLIVTGRHEIRRQILTRGPVGEKNGIAIFFKIIASVAILLPLRRTIPALSAEFVPEMRVGDGVYSIHIASRQRLQT